MFRGKKVILTLTGCKRLSLLKTTIKSFSIFCSDKETIDEIHYFDDSSSSSERDEAVQCFHKYLPNIPLYYRYFDANSFPDNFRHARILNWMRHHIQSSNADYVFHTEDDWRYVNKFSIGEPINIMERFHEYAYIGYGSSVKNFPEGMKPKITIGNFWETVYFNDRPVKDFLFLDDVSAMQQGPDWWMYYLNWPYFSLRPGVHHAKRLLSVGEFSIAYDTSTSSTELEFALRWKNAGYKSMNCNNYTVIHTGGDQCSFDLNKSIR